MLANERRESVQTFLTHPSGWMTPFCMQMRDGFAYGLLIRDDLISSKNNVMSTGSNVEVL
jgi:hypothetical protein